MANGLVYILQSLVSLYLMAFVVRLSMHWARSDFRNPIVQFVLTVTNPLVLPLRRFVPPVYKIDSATLIIFFPVAVGDHGLTGTPRLHNVPRRRNSPWADGNLGAATNTERLHGSYFYLRTHELDWRGWLQPVTGHDQWAAARTGGTAARAISADHSADRWLRPVSPVPSSRSAGAGTDTGHSGHPACGALSLPDRSDYLVR